MDWSETRVLLTGGTGTFGQAFARQLLKCHSAARVRIFSRDEWKQQRMATEFTGKADRMEFFLGDVRDQARLVEAGSGCDVWIHAAALKQIPACEAHPLEAFKTNLLGTANLLQAAGSLKPRWVVCLSTDKAVQPTNVYGASKMGAERLAVNASEHLDPRTRVCLVRYGNVLGSRGSVIPEFLEQSRQGGTLAITDVRMTRFWIPQQAAVDFVLRAPAIAHGGEILIPKARSLRLVDLAKVVAPTTPTETIGLRQGEKIHEMLLSEEESRRALELDDHYVVLPRPPSLQQIARFPGARSVPEGFRYTSDTNSAWWSPEDLRSLLPTG